MFKLNLGSGKRPMAGWENIDAVKHTPETIVGNVLHLQYEDGSIEAIFSEHMIEHLNRNEADRFFSECSRMLKSGGTLEIIAPNPIIMMEKYFAKQNFGFYDTRFVDIDVLADFLWGHGDDGHLYDYHKQGIYKEKLERWCTKHGFEVLEIGYQDREHSENEIYLKAKKRG